MLLTNVSPGIACFFFVVYLSNKHSLQATRLLTPLVNLVFGVKYPQQRNRILNPKHVAYHGYLPHHDSEKGFILMTDSISVLNKNEINAADVAPTLLKMVGQSQPVFMAGKARLEA